MYEPSGIDFIDLNSGKHCRYVTEGYSAGWVCYKHPNGQWVTLKKPSHEEITAIMLQITKRKS